MFGTVVRTLCRHRRGVTLVAGAIGVLTTARALLSVPPKAAAPKRAAPDPAKSRIKISQTRSEVGFVYWVVRETGPNPSYALFDTWQDAMNEAARRMAAARAEEALVLV